MKKIVLLLALSALLTFPAFAQDSPPKADSLLYVETNEADILNALQLLGVRMYKVSIPADTVNVYTMVVHIDEYEKDSLIREDHYGLTKTFSSFTPPEGERLIRIARDFTFTIADADRENRKFNLRVTGVDGNRILIFGLPLFNESQTEVAEKYKDNSYDSRPFVQQAFVPDTKIPVVLYGSFWYDERFNFYRFCGSNELDAEFQDDIFTSSPHYVILSLEFRSEEK